MRSDCRALWIGIWAACALPACGGGSVGTDGDGDADADADSDADSDTDADSDADADADGDRCRTFEDCPTDEGYTDCFPSEASSFPTGACGYCEDLPDECQIDVDCGAGFACRHEGPCACGVLQRICVAGCGSDAECLHGQTCNEDSHCVATLCDRDADCASQFLCGPGTCSRRSCTADGECDGAGFCVNRACYDDIGTCGEAVAVP